MSVVLKYAPDSGKNCLAHLDVRFVIDEMRFFRSANYNTVLARKQITMTTIEVLQLRLRRQNYQLSFDRLYQAILPDITRTEPRTIYDQVFFEGSHVGDAQKLLLNEQ